MKTPKLKAKELFDKYYQLTNPTSDSNDIWIFTYTMKELAKKSSIIAVDEIFEHIDYIFTELEKDKLPNKFDDEIEYWNEVKKEIELL
jgi:hypothetical protein